MHQIHLEKLSFYAHHGLFPEETAIGAGFELDVLIDTDFSESMVSDELEGSLDYAVVYKICAEEMKQPSKLLENLAYRIIKRIKSSNPSVQKVKIKVSKLNPPIGGEMEKVSILIEE